MEVKHVPPALEALIRRRLYVELTGSERVDVKSKLGSFKTRTSAALATKRLVEADGAADDAPGDFVMWKASK